MPWRIVDKMKQVCTHTFRRQLDSEAQVAYSIALAIAGHLPYAIDCTPKQQRQSRTQHKN